MYARLPYAFIHEITTEISEALIYVAHSVFIFIILWIFQCCKHWLWFSQSSGITSKLSHIAWFIWFVLCRKILLLSKNLNVVWIFHLSLFDRVFLFSLSHSLSQSHFVVVFFFFLLLCLCVGTCATACPPCEWYPFLLTKLCLLFCFYCVFHCCFYVNWNSWYLHELQMKYFSISRIFIEMQTKAKATSTSANRQQLWL